MNRLKSAVLFALSLVAFVAAPAGADEQAPPTAALVPLIASVPVVGSLAHRRAKAPADEYFGRFKMSILGVRNVVNDVDARADNAADDAAQRMCARLILAEDALRDWQAKYPDDAWIPKLGYALLRDYEKVDSAIVTDDSHVASIHAIDLADWLGATYVDSEFAPK